MCMRMLDHMIKIIKNYMKPSCRHRLVTESCVNSAIMNGALNGTKKITKNVWIGENKGTYNHASSSYTAELSNKMHHIPSGESFVDMQQLQHHSSPPLINLGVL
jgi:hypothetical protein